MDYIRNGEQAIDDHFVIFTLLHKEALLKRLKLWIIFPFMNSSSIEVRWFPRKLSNVIMMHLICKMFIGKKSKDNLTCAKK